MKLKQTGLAAAAVRLQMQVAGRGQGVYVRNTQPLVHFLFKTLVMFSSAACIVSSSLLHICC